MIQHYLKIVFRNILKHKTQSIISIVGLAIGLACFALSTFWIQYEMTYDSFHRDADRITLSQLCTLRFRWVFKKFLFRNRRLVCIRTAIFFHDAEQTVDGISIYSA